MRNKLKNKSRKSTASESDQEHNDGSEANLNAKHILNSLKNKAQQQLQKLSSSKIGVPKGWRRVTVIMREDYYEQIKELSYIEKIPIKDILDEVIGRFLASAKKPLSHKSSGK